MKKKVYNRSRLQSIKNMCVSGTHVENVGEMKEFLILNIFPYYI